jgi:type II secretion system protein J
MELLEDVEAIEFRFLDVQREWQTEWPPLGAAGPIASRARPLAVEVAVELLDWGRITRRVESGG